MKFPLVFSRYVSGAAGQPTLGGDSVPKCDVVPAIGKPGTNSGSGGPGDNVFYSARVALTGFPVQRLMIGCRYIGSATPAVIPVTVYIYEQASGAWFAMNSTAVNVTATITTGNGVQPTSVGTIVYTDIPSLMDKPPTLANLQDGNATGVWVMIVPANTGNTGNAGEYRFCVAADMATSP